MRLGRVADALKWKEPLLGSRARSGKYSEENRHFRHLIEETNSKGTRMRRFREFCGLIHTYVPDQIDARDYFTILSPLIAKSTGKV